MSKETGLPLAEGLNAADDIPHTLSFAVLYRTQINSFHNLPKEKQPPRDLWTKPHRLKKFLDEVWEKKDKNQDVIEWDDEDIE